MADVCWPRPRPCLLTRPPSPLFKSVATTPQPVEPLPRRLLVHRSVCLVHCKFSRTDPVAGWRSLTSTKHPGWSTMDTPLAFKKWVAISCPWSLPKPRGQCLQYWVFELMLRGRNPSNRFIPPAWRRFLTPTMHFGEPGSPPFRLPWSLRVPHRPSSTVPAPSPNKHYRLPSPPPSALPWKDWGGGLWSSAPGLSLPDQRWTHTWGRLVCSWSSPSRISGLFSEQTLGVGRRGGDVWR